MLQKIRDLMKSDKGFTLIELIVVVVILGILAAIAIPRFMNRTGDATEARIYADTKIVQNAVDLYLVDYPNAGNVLYVPAYGPDTMPGEEDYGYGKLIPGYLKTVPEPPVGYTYEIDGTEFKTTH